MRDLIKVSMLAMIAQISTAYTIVVATEFLLQEMCILTKQIFMIEKILNPRKLLIMSGIRKIMSSLQTSQIYGMLASLLLSGKVFFPKFLRLIPILISHAAPHPFQISQI